MALIHCSEGINVRHFPFTAGYASLMEQAEAEVFGPCIVGGPLDLRVSYNPHSMQVKHIDSPIRGSTDALVFPDVEVRNSFHKTVILFAHDGTACML